MAKRKRLTPARLPDGAAPETKSMFPRYPDGVYRAPIADVAHDAATSAALSEVAQELTAARSQGRLIQAIPLDAVDVDYLVRDRMVVDADDMAALVDSLRARGQQTAIEVTGLDDGRYGLISGWRRLTALRQLRDETPESDTVLAIVRHPADAADAYLAMVEENEIRVGLSYYERARIVARAVDKGVYRADRVALPALFHAASRAKRSKIGAFVRIVRALDDVLRFPTAITERVGLALSQAMEADANVADDLRKLLLVTGPDTPEAEAAAIADVLDGPKPARPPAPQKQQHQPRPDLRVTEHGDGRLVLDGAAVKDPAFRADLLQWLAQK